MKRALGIVVLVALVPACFSRIRQAEELVAQGRYVEAAELLERLAREEPKNTELPKAVERVRFLAVEDALGQARQHRLLGDTATSQRRFADGLALRKRWNVKLSGALESTIDDERDDATQKLRRLVQPRTQKGEALAAEAVVERHRFLLEHEELSALRTEVTDAVSRTGRGTCKRLLPTIAKTEPYWTSLVVRYCRHFEEEAPAEPVLADTCTLQQASVNVASLGDGLSGRLKGLLEGAFHKSPWYAERGPRGTTLWADGRAAVSLRQDWAPMFAEWVERVPYEVEVKQVLEEKVPVTECEVYEEDAPGTQKGRVTRSREVTREKVKKREVMVKETRFRDVPRVFEYRALRVDRVLGFSVRAELRGQDQPLASSGHEATDTAHGYQHDVSFDAAGVRPTRPSFEPQESWLSRNVHRAAEDFAGALVAGWRARFCGQPSYSPEEAARCVRAVEGVPPSAVEALRQRLGEDAAQVSVLYAPRGAPRVGPAR